jgi:hypothetical protein
MESVQRRQINVSTGAVQRLIAGFTEAEASQAGRGQHHNGTVVYLYQGLLVHEANRFHWLHFCRFSCYNRRASQAA